MEPRLLEHDGELGGDLLRDADLLGGEVAWRSAEADRANELSAGDHRYHHVRSDIRGEQGFGLRTRGQRADIDQLWFAPPQGLYITRELQRIADDRPAVEPVAAYRREPRHLSGLEVEQIHDGARNFQQVS